jgi:hypothetical protein
MIACKGRNKYDACRRYHLIILFLRLCSVVIATHNIANSNQCDQTYAILDILDEYSIDETENV